MTKGVTITDYLEDFYSENMEGRLPVQRVPRLTRSPAHSRLILTLQNPRFQQEVILLSRSETGKGWDVKTRSTVTDEESSHAWDVVILAHGVRLSLSETPLFDH